ncbi:MAG: creatininase family protein [Burkholderiales bacterium]|nr:creatininase family protein [Burkholderiales bacterium]
MCGLWRKRRAAAAALGLMLAALVGAPGAVAQPRPAAPLPTARGPVQLERLTSPELRARIAAGTRTVLLPIGGTEQNGPHMVLGKHNVRAGLLAARIAEQLGDAVVAPVLAYVPEGDIDAPTQHMRYTGTISIAEPAFEAVIEDAARSLRRHGFTLIVLLGDHGGYTHSLHRAADRANRAFAGGGAPARVLVLQPYYDAAQHDFPALLEKRGFSKAEIGLHAGLGDTSLALAVDPSLVRADVLAAAAGAKLDGVSGDPRRASAELGRLGVEHIIAASVAAIRSAERRAPSAASAQ